MALNEALLHFIWQHQLLEPMHLITTEGEPVQIERTGIHNHDAGPDFLDARLRIGTTLWAGHVEIHLSAKDWMHHRHHLDKNYDNVILHVVMQDDHHLNIPTLELDGKLPVDLLLNYQHLMESQTWVPCASSIKEANSFKLESWKSRLVIERLERKSLAFKDDLTETENDWEECHYRNLMRSFGQKVNKASFNELALLLPYKILKKHIGDVETIEAMLFGVAGLLESPLDEYQTKLKEEFRHYRHKYGLKVMDANSWKFATLRPSNFPTVRIAQFASLVKGGAVSFSALIDLESPKHLYKVFDTGASSYWDDHYRFGIDAKKMKKRLGLSSIRTLFINHIVPLLYTYGWYKGLTDLKEKAVLWLEETPTEQNTIVRKWSEIGLESTTAFDSQSLIELKNEYCSKKKCLNCGIGSDLLRNSLRNER